VEIECYMIFEASSVQEKKVIWSLLDIKNKLMNQDDFINAAQKANPDVGVALAEKLLESVPFNELRGEVYKHKTNKKLALFNYLGSPLNGAGFHEILLFIDGMFPAVKTRATLTFDGLLEHDIQITGGELQVTATADFNLE